MVEKIDIANALVRKSWMNLNVSFVLLFEILSVQQTIKNVMTFKSVQKFSREFVIIFKSLDKRTKSAIITVRKRVIRSMKQSMGPFILYKVYFHM